MMDMYNDISKSKYDIEQKIMRNALATATLPPAEFGYSLMKQEGYMGMVIREVVHLIKCLKVEVVQRVRQECYEVLPITWRKQDYLLSPKTRIIVRSKTPIHCDSRFPSMLSVQPRLRFKILPNMMVKADKPKILEPATTPTWTNNST